MKPADSASAAIRGATLAFQRDKLDHKQEASSSPATRQPLGRRNNSHVVDNGAYTAATEAVRSTGTAGRTTISTTPEHHYGAAAAVVGSLGASRPPPQLEAQQKQQQQQQQQRHSGASAAFASQAAHLGLAPAAARLDGKNPSLIAATLAASRSASPTRSTTTTTTTTTTAKMAKMVGIRAESSASSAGSSSVVGGDVDSGPLASAGSLISLFERGNNGKGPSPPESVVSGAGAEDKIRPVVMAKKAKKPNKTVERDMRAPPPTPPPAPKTRRDPMAETAPGGDGKSVSAAAEVSGLRAGIDQPLQTSQKQQRQSTGNSNNQRQQTQKQPTTTTQRPMTPAATTPLPQHKSKPTGLHPATPPPLKPLMSRNVAEIVSPQPTRATKTPLSPIASPHLTLNPSIHVALASPSPDPPKKRHDVVVMKRPPTPPKPRGHGHRRSDSGDEPKLRGRSYSHHLDAAASSQSRAAIASAMVRSGQSVSPQHSGSSSRPSSMFLSRRHSMASAASTPARPLGNASPGHTPLDNLTDAIMAGSLASSRLTPHHTGSKLVPPPVPKRQKSPRMLHTLRNPHQVSDDDEDSHKKGHRALLRKGKHAHHEGSRKKWREEIRPRERKRYEALWASNRGVLLTDTRLMSPATSISSDLDRDLSQCVANVVVRQVWRRSRLPPDELAEIYDLVDRSRMGMLGRAEFVVGTWLVDQRLKGRKVPARVTDSVWGSANGVTVKGPNGK
ncbi:hypothetical protein ACQKWADRAFT_295186 [Trichoderma austrokoningii]